jgi:nanoRNase/pAp phosphatase (c-di-AMP/oligoRNAs hydrolase)
MERSGALIAWDYFHPKMTVPSIILHVSDRDLWKFEMLRTNEVFAAMTSHDFDLATWDLLFNRGVDKLIAEGEAIERYRQQLIKLAVEGAQRATIAGHNVPIVNCIYAIASDTAGILARGEPFAAYYIEHDNVRQFGLRSEDSGMDVNEIAKLFGGGGHVHAAGFKMPLFGEMVVTPRRS